MRGVYGKARQRIAVGAEAAGSFNATPLIVVGAGIAVVIAILKNERELGRGR